MYIPDDKVDEIRAASDVVDVVSDYVKLKRRGSNYFGLCPFHNEKSPSFSVNPSMGIFKCFGCGAGGNVYQFVMRIEGLSFPETVRMLAERAGIPLPEEPEERERASEVESIYHALKFAGRFFYEQLTQTPAGQPALAYLKQRGFSAKTIKQFGLGYAPDRWDALLNAAEAGHIEAETLEKAGLVLPRKDGSGHYDRFRGRVIFPIFSHVGKVLGFGGRILQADSDQPKYINSPETKVYNKSRVLYGLFQGKQAIRKHEEAILVEGYTDVISMHQAGVQNVVASSGTALTEEQVKMLSRYAKRILLLYDADAAGAEAALRGIDLVLEQGLSAYAIALPGGDDPDSYVRENGGEAFVEYARKHRQDFAAFKYHVARRQGRLDTPEGEAEMMHDLVATIARIPDPLMQETFLKRTGEMLGTGDMKLRPILAERMRDQQQRSSWRPEPEQRPVAAAEAVENPNAPVAVAEKPVAAEPLSQEKTLLRLMLKHKMPLVEFILANISLDEFAPGPSRTIASMLLEMYQQGVVETDQFFDGSLDGEVQSLAAEVLIDRHEASENWEQKNITVARADPFEEAKGAIRQLMMRRVEAAMRRQQDLIYQATQQGEDQRPLQTQLMELVTIREKIRERKLPEWN